MIQAYEDLHPEAPHHILTDPSMRRMFVTSLYTFNEETGMFTPAKNLVETPRCRQVNEKSRIWNDFVFQEIGDGGNFIALGLTAGIYDAETQFVLPGVIDEASPSFFRENKTCQRMGEPCERSGHGSH